MERLPEKKRDGFRVMADKDCGGIARTAVNIGVVDSGPVVGLAPVQGTKLDWVIG